MSRMDAQGRWTANHRKLARQALVAGFFWTAISAAFPLFSQSARPAAPSAKPAAPIAKSTKPATAAPGATTPNAKAPARVANLPDARTPGQQLTTVALVNGDPISRQQLAQECVLRYGNEILETMVNRRMIETACAQAKITITEKDVEAEIRRMAAKFKIPVDQWIRMLEDERGITEQQYKNEIVWPTLALRALASDKLEITQEEMQRAFERKFGERIRARIITVKELEKAKEIHAKVAANPSKFAEYAKNHSEDANSASAHGIIPPIRMHMGEPELEKAAFALAEGQVSDILFINEQYHILKCDRREPQIFVDPKNMAHAEETLRDEIHDEKLRAASADLFKRMQDQAKVVNVFNDKKLSQQHPGVAALINGQPITIAQLSEECLARHQFDVLEGEINRKIMTQELKNNNKQVTQQDLDEEIARAAISYGYVKADGSPDFATWQKALEQNDGATLELYIRDAVWPTVALKKLVGDSVQITQDEMKKGFEANYGERVEALAIVLNEQRQAQKVWEMARANLTEESFASLAEQYSVDPISRGNGGQVPPIRKHSGQPVLETAAFKLKTGELSGLIAIEDKYVILYCLGRTNPVTKDFKAVEKLLYEDLYEKKLRVSMAKEFDRMKEDATWENFLTADHHDGRKKLGPALPDSSVKPAGGTKPIAQPRAGSVLSGAK